MVALKLYYFEAGPADPIRLIFAISGMKFVDERIQMDQWPALKASGKFPLGQLPVLEFEDGTQITQNQAIMRYVAALNPSTGLYPLDLKQRFRVDEMMDIVKDIQSSFFMVMKAPEGEERGAAQNNLYKKVLPFFFSKIEERMGDHEYTAGDALTIADLALYGIYELLHLPFVGGLPEDLFTPYTKITRVFDAIKTHPAVKLWEEKHEVMTQ
ncbi:Glutathione S-transferase, putative [Perkinsus marinus ATCC 50983]|uniref:Glutathione S-transferase, putative n=1 Tax=Perkinsus marinus (strain ATCC 50983 / TXsc) TaxID=423536 RepID=C5KLJ7_PERM5|nr:Glutathione S-transferase, putative [Perkinsus marinus ATCC 50983]EER14648.1 Glutathione S-transferase, putative [Perkinsus marinus ATCC 50983]|eukprot:XP_002782852.1 Glutathione S-transferase, putative [Perkinsus marinus ATCC 50983]